MFKILWKLGCFLSPVSDFCCSLWFHPFKLRWFFFLNTGVIFFCLNQWSSFQESIWEYSVKSREESGIWHTSHLSTHADLLCFLWKESKFCELQALFWRSCNWKSLPNHVSSATQNMLKQGQPLFLMVKKTAKLRKQSHFPRRVPHPRHMVAFKLYQHS